MICAVKLLAGLPVYGPLATAFPTEWGRRGREGVVVEFTADVGAWVANFKPGLAGMTFAQFHPNQHDAIVVAAGDLWVVDPDRRTAELLLPAINAALEVESPDGWVFDRQGLAVVRFGPDGIVWHTKRLSWDGFDQLRIVDDEVTGFAWDPEGTWYPFRVDIRTGRSIGGSFSDEDIERWERVAD